ncbi:restriction endonuclease subunit S [Enterobacter cloacae]|uniref:restriction endonuclease subunit S n=1 Tax=Enterobacter cloacae TaxID=550 RepID=UPI0032AEE0CD
MVPKLRFSEFNMPWKQTTLGSVSSYAAYGMNSSAIEFDGVNKYIRITDIDDDTREFIPSPLTTPSGKLDNQYLLKKGDIVFARTGASVGKSYLYNEKDGKLYFAGFLIKFTINKANPYFVYNQTFTEKYRKWVKIHSMRSGQPGINAEEYKEFEFAAPALEEQTKIADFLSSVDGKITLLKKQYDLLCRYKKGMMRKIFSQELIFKDEKGNNFPKWEIKKIGSCISEYKNTTSLENEYPVMTSSRSGLVFQNDYYGNNRLTERSNIGFNIIPCNYLTYRSRSDDGLFFFNQNKLNVTGCISIYYPVFKFKDGDDYFYITMFNYFKNRFRAYAVGSSQLVLSMTDLKKMKFSIPCPEEQIKITEFFSAIDKRIYTTKSTLDKLKTWKQGLLQQMFV